MTTVVSFRDVKAHWIADRRRFDDKALIYIGRANKTYNLPDTVWGNPYPVKVRKGESEVSARLRSINAYRDYIQRKPELLAQVRTLRGKTLVCWCKDAAHPDRACHGDVLLELLGEIERVDGSMELAQPGLETGEKPILSWDGGFAMHRIGIDRHGILYRTEDVIEHPAGLPGKIYETWVEWDRDNIRETLRVRGGASLSGMSPVAYARFRYEQGLIARANDYSERALLECSILRDLIDELEQETL